MLDAPKSRRYCSFEMQSLELQVRRDPMYMLKNLYWQYFYVIRLYLRPKYPRDRNSTWPLDFCGKTSESWRSIQSVLDGQALIGIGNLLTIVKILQSMLVIYLCFRELLKSVRNFYIPIKLSLKSHVTWDLRKCKFLCKTSLLLLLAGICSWNKIWDIF